MRRCGGNSKERPMPVPACLPTFRCTTLVGLVARCSTRVHRHRRRQSCCGRCRCRCSSAVANPTCTPVPSCWSCCCEWYPTWIRKRIDDHGPRWRASPARRGRRSTPPGLRRRRTVTCCWPRSRATAAMMPCSCEWRWRRRPWTCWRRRTERTMMPPTAAPAWCCWETTTPMMMTMMTTRTTAWCTTRRQQGATAGSRDATPSCWRHPDRAPRA
mmetsp:Transcript_26660/g.74634  ORF Transcript_26660/g.74634 Transcript_26660/m.74634 type:complete len:214 (-) Transcript_26660:278-919(-)